ncbi:tRNA dihydrouridine(20/20a) synthase DusA [Methylogaea oryzae]|uniref:tRNA-dihydrouridine(20/20a) synthase n=1 Tax=Methylogaea oryzae TaxID=1295382 RepID=A0A8D5AH74_9GAMM|nr:tRNA dihydrouridine(20/20a) synthase DusA [Methylogaea oryzae]BBL71173.1 tRNA-dihydrouridine(20/20a) synthase [Methylogaea oryzae]
MLEAISEQAVRRPLPPQGGDKILDRRLSVAPMLDWTDRDYRYFARLLTRHTLLYTEMITAAALHHGDPSRLLAFDALEGPVALQLGGSDPRLLAQGAVLGADFGYDEINLNVGCPSPRVSKGRFGACLMLEPELVAECIQAMAAAVSLPVTVKTRIGVDEQDSFEQLHRFVETVAQAGCRTFIVHARKAWLQGLSPKQNREIPPLQYERVWALKQAFPGLEFILNGGVVDLDQAEAHLQRVDGVMIGRAAYHDPYLLAEADGRLYGDRHPAPSRAEVVHRLLPYVAMRLSCGLRFQQIARHLLGLFHGQPGGRAWRRHISTFGVRPGADERVLLDALDAVALAAAEQRHEPTG